MDSISPCFAQNLQSRKDEKNSCKKMDSISPLKKWKNLRQCVPVLEVTTDRSWCCDVPPRPTPLPAPIQATDFWACPCQGWGRVGARAGLVLGMITPPSTPLPSALFFRGVPRGGGLREALRYPDVPRPVPHLSTPGSSTLLARLESWGGEAGEGAGTGVQRPPYHPNLR